ncbi:hypothetical protein [Streptomyces sp. NPDC058463]|uniref:hypothetical protein n=1 Tax=Streptomyces sp. NPDC058463 TaxID=3346510 RepID=UPI00364F49E3
MNPDPDTAATGPSGLILPLALAAELAARRPTADGPRPAEVRTATTGRGRRAARRRAAAVRG